MRNIGNYIAAVKVFNARDVDELVFLDISATDEQRDPYFPLISDVARECFMPLAVGGGVSTLDHVERLLRVGADKVVLNSSLERDPAFTTLAANRYGAQCIVASIDAKKDSTGVYHAYAQHGQKEIPGTVVDWAKECERRGAGEIFLTSIDHDGMMNGYDVELTKLVATTVSIPVIASGGAGTPDDCVEIVRDGRADAVSAASIFQYTQYTPQDIKQAFVAAGIPARL